MNLVTIPAHFDGKQIQFDDWMSLAIAGLESAYGENEPEYSLNLIIEPNPNYERK